MFPYLQGQQDALSFFGVSHTKVAGKAKLLSRAGKKVKSWMPTWGGVKRFFVGEPGKFVGELRKGKALSKGSLIREGFQAPGVINKALFYGLPALDVISTARSNSPDKPGDIAGILGGTAASMAAFRPFGLLGAMAGGMGGSALARKIFAKNPQEGEEVSAEGVSSPQNPSVYAPLRQRYPYAAGANYLVGGGG
jgi:hypothetical protein